jgi:general secretion pathway protein L
MLNEIFAWWLRQMLALAPSRFRGRDTGPANAIVLAWDEAAGRAELLMRRDHKEASLGRFTLDEAGPRLAGAMLGNRRAAATVLRLPPGLLLERQVTLPLAAEQGLERVARYEMDRFTPFAADEVYFSCVVRRRDRARGKLVAAISLVPRARLAPAIDALARLGLAPGLLESPVGPGDEVRRIPLGDAAPGEAVWRRRGLIAAGAGCAVLALIAAGLPFCLQAGASAAVEQRIAALKPSVDQAEALRRRIEAAAAGSDAIGAERARVGDALHAIATLTDILGNDTHLLGLSMQKRLVTLEGQSAAAARLLTTLSADPTVRNAAFVAPVTRSGGGADLFSIRAEIAP